MRLPSKDELIERLATFRAKQYDDTLNIADYRYFWRRECPTRRDLLLACWCHDLLTREELRKLDEKGADQ